MTAASLVTGSKIVGVATSDGRGVLAGCGATHLPQLEQGSLPTNQKAHQKSPPNFPYI